QGAQQPISKTHTAIVLVDARHVGAGLGERGPALWCTTSATCALVGLAPLAVCQAADERPDLLQVDRHDALAVVAARGDVAHRDRLEVQTAADELVRLLREAQYVEIGVQHQ